MKRKNEEPPIDTTNPKKMFSCVPQFTLNLSVYPLANEIWKVVFSFLSKSEWFNVLVTCKLFYFIMRSNVYSPIHLICALPMIFDFYKEVYCIEILNSIKISHTFQTIKPLLERRFYVALNIVLGENMMNKFETIIVLKHSVKSRDFQIIKMVLENRFFNDDDLDDCILFCIRMRYFSSIRAMWSSRTNKNSFLNRIRKHSIALEKQDFMSNLLADTKEDLFLNAQTFVFVLQHKMEESIERFVKIYKNNMIFNNTFCKVL